MSAGLTTRQADLLDFIKTYLADHKGAAPKFREMCDALGLKSKAGVHRLLCGLEERGRIRRYRNRQQAIELVDQDCTCPHCGRSLAA